jgi:hypothetical protein
MYQAIHLHHENTDDPHEYALFNTLVSSRGVEAGCLELSLPSEDSEILGTHGTPSVTNTPDGEVASKKRRYSAGYEGATVERSAYNSFLRKELAKLDHNPNSSNQASVALLYHPGVGELGAKPIQVHWMRWLWLFTGSGQSVIDFKEYTRATRDQNLVPYDLFSATLSPAETFQKICHLEDQEAFCVLAKRCHAVKLFETLHANRQKTYEMTVATPDTFGRAQRALRGNPDTRSEAKLIDEMLQTVSPGLVQGTVEYDRVRTKLLRLRRLVKRLRVLTRQCGYGILALLPYGRSNADLALTDNKLVIYIR